MSSENQPKGLDWPGLIRAGLRPQIAGGLGLLPAQFWALTPAELSLMLGIEPGQGGMTRERLAVLSARFPDLGRPMDQKQEKEFADGRKGRD